MVDEAIEIKEIAKSNLWGEWPDIEGTEKAIEVKVELRWKKNSDFERNSPILN